MNGGGTEHKTCVFCGAGGKLTGEHVFGDWLSTIGLSEADSAHGVGPLNRSLRDIGTTRPFMRKVRDVCGPCNHGWMSSLEATAKRVLAPLILGNAGTISSVDLASIAAWAHKTALVAMLMSSAAERARGGGLPASEYRALYDARNVGPPARTQFWIGRYSGEQRLSAAWVTPMVVQVAGLPEPELPHAYVTNVIVGSLLLEGVRFTSPGLEVDLSTVQSFARLWPEERDVSWPSGEAVDDARFVDVSLGRNLRVKHDGLTLRAWRPATELSASQADGEVVRLPTPCGQHFVCYPAALVAEAFRGVFYAFISQCECEKAYLVHTEADGAHFKAEAVREARKELAERYEALPGEEITLGDTRGMFVCKRLATNARVAGR